MPTQTGTIDLRSGNAVRLYTEQGFSSLDEKYIDQSKLETAADGILASVRKEIYEVDPETGLPTSEARWKSAIDVAADGIRSDVSETYATKDDLKDEATARTTFQQSTDDFLATISQSYATKDEVATLVRAYGDGVLVCRKGQTIGALINADGSFDVVSLTWEGDVPKVEVDGQNKVVPLTRIAADGATFGKASGFHMAIETVGEGTSQTQRLGFYDEAGTLVAYMQNGLMYVANTMVLHTMRVGEDDPNTQETEGWEWKYQTADSATPGNLTLRWVG